MGYHSSESCNFVMSLFRGLSKGSASEGQGEEGMVCEDAAGGTSAAGPWVNHFLSCPSASFPYSG